MTNIAFVENNFLPTMGGVERVTYVLGEAIRQRGYGVYYIFRGIDSSENDSSYKLKIDDALSPEELYNMVAQYIEQFNIQLLVCQNLHTRKYRDIYLRLKIEKGIKIISCLHANPDIWVNKNVWGCTTTIVYFKELLRSALFLFHNRYKDKMEGMYEICDKYVLLSESFKATFRSLYHVDGDKLCAISNPCAFSENKSDNKEKENAVLVVARMAEQQKRISNVLMIWKRIYPNNPEWKLTIVGDGPDINYYKKTATKNGLQNVTFVGQSKEPQKYYQTHKIFMMTSIWEGYPMTLIEAQHYGCVPIVYDSYSAVYDIINNGKNGMIVPLHDINAYVEIMNSLMNNYEKLNSMSQAALSTSGDRFNIGHIVEQWIALFNELGY